MSILQNAGLQEQWKLAINLYNDKVLPTLMKNKVIAISAAVALSLLYIIRDRVLKPPRKLRHVPYIGYFSVLKSLITGESFWDRTFRVRIPISEAEGSKGLYLVLIVFHESFVYYFHHQADYLFVLFRSPEDLDGKYMCQILKMLNVFYLKMVSKIDDISFF